MNSAVQFTLGLIESNSAVVSLKNLATSKQVSPSLTPNTVSHVGTGLAFAATVQYKKMISIFSIKQETIVCSWGYNNNYFKLGRKFLSEKIFVACQWSLLVMRL